MVTLEGTASVFRAMRRSSINKLTGEIDPVEFLRRPPPQDEMGLSVDTVSIESCALSRDNVRVGELQVGQIRLLGLDVVPDTVTHANITGCPRKEEDLTRAMFLANELVKKTRLIPDEETPKRPKKKR
jgi:hypothetical protein